MLRCALLSAPSPAWLLGGILMLLSLAPTAGFARDAPGVIVAEARLESIAERVEALGTLRARESVVITSTVTETVSAVHFKDGQRVEAETLLVEMTSTEEHALLEEAQARLEEAKRQHRRVRSLVAQGSASRSLLDERQRDLEAARAVLGALESRLADRIIKAPFAGVLGLRAISQGALVEPGDVITTLDDDSLIKLDFPIPSRYLAALAPGLEIEAHSHAWPERVFRGTVSAIDSRIDPVTRAIQVRALLPNPEHLLRPGLLMRVELLVAPREAVVVPESALLQESTSHWVLALSKTEPPLAERREVEIGQRGAGWVEVRSGLSAGEQVIVDGLQRARAGEAVRVLAVDDGSRSLSELLGETRP